MNDKHKVTESHNLTICGSRSNQ